MKTVNTARLFGCLLLFSLFLSTKNAAGQTVIEQPTSINTGGNAPDTSAILHVQSTTKGVLFPRMTTAERNAIAGPADGLMVYDTDLDGYYFYTNGQWSTLNNSSSTFWTANGADIGNNNAGSVGINTTSPQTDLEIVQAFGTTSTTSGLQLNAANRRWRMTVGGANAGDAAHFQLLYRNHNVSTYAPYLTVKHTGEVGIGTTNPEQKLHTDGNVRADGGEFQSWGAISIQPDVDNSGDDQILFKDGTGNEVARFHSNGYFGLGTNNPVAPMHIVGSPTLGSLIVAPDEGINGDDAELVLAEDKNAFFNMKFVYDGGDNQLQLLGQANSLYYGPHLVVNRDDGRIGIGTTSPASELEVKVPFNTTATSSGITLNASDRRWRMTVGGDNTSNPAFFQLLFKNQANADIPYLTCNSSGGVAIGSKFATGYKLSVDGKVACEEVFVELDSAWPDYVFSEHYDLLPLPEVEQHIREKGHLPGLPSAREIDGKGIEVGEMNRLLVEKVEELTLHLIAQQKQLEEQRVLIEELLKNANR